MRATSAQLSACLAVATDTQIAQGRWIALQEYEFRALLRHAPRLGSRGLPRRGSLSILEIKDLLSRVQPPSAIRRSIASLTIVL
jgi:hypothetical protein